MNASTTLGKGSRYSLTPPRLLETGENSFSSFNFIVAIFNGSIFQRFFSKPIVGVFCWTFLQCIYFSFVKCKAPFLVASPASLRKYSSFVIVKTINGEKSEKKRYKKTGKNIQRKGNYFKRGERRRTNRVTLAYDKGNKKKLIRKLSNFTF